MNSFSVDDNETTATTELTSVRNEVFLGLNSSIAQEFTINSLPPGGELELVKREATS